MNNEIKEILEFLSNENYYIQDIDCKFKRLYLDEVKTLLDYITNLEEENRILKELNVCVGCNNNLDYKSRIDKALDYIVNDMPYLEEPDDDYENNHKMIEYDKSILLNILQGEDKEIDQLEK